MHNQLQRRDRFDVSLEEATRRNWIAPGESLLYGGKRLILLVRDDKFNLRSVNDLIPILDKDMYFWRAIFNFRNDHLYIPEFHCYECGVDFTSDEDSARHVCFKDV